MNWKQRVVWSLPYVFVIGAAIGVEVTEEIRFAIVALVGMWFLPSPLTQFPQNTNVSRETSDSEGDYASEWGKDNLPPLSNVSRETISAPCVVMHGSAEPHVLGCDGWTFDQS